MNVNATGNTFRIIETTVNKPERSLWVRQHPSTQDGMIWIDQFQDTFHMDYYNCDGSPAKICGNGARACIFYLYRTHSLRKSQWMNLSTDAGLLKGKVEPDDSVIVSMPGPCWSGAFDFDKDSIELIELGNRHILLDLKIPQTVIETDLFQIVREIRERYPSFGQCNVNVFAGLGSEVWIRTFENGVEKETQSCGSGCTAVCFSLHQKNPSSLQSWLLHTAGGSLAVKYMAPDYYLQGKVVIE